MKNLDSYERRQTEFIFRETRYLWFTSITNIYVWTLILLYFMLYVNVQSLQLLFWLNFHLYLIFLYLVNSFAEREVCTPSRSTSQFSPDRSQFIQSKCVWYLRKEQKMIMLKALWLLVKCYIRNWYYYHQLDDLSDHILFIFAWKQKRKSKMICLLTPEYIIINV